MGARASQGYRIRDANMDIHGRVTFDAVGPIPHPAIEADFPGLDEATADRIVDRDSAEHRHFMESEAKRRSPRRRSLDPRSRSA